MAPRIGLQNKHTGLTYEIVSQEKKDDGTTLVKLRDLSNGTEFTDVFDKEKFKAWGYSPVKLEEL